MNAVILAAGQQPGTDALNRRFPTPLLPLGDRPFLQHVVEWLAARGVTDIRVVVSHLPEKVERLLGDGSRWGCRISCHLARDPERPCEALSRMFTGDDETPILLAHGHSLPLLEEKALGAGDPVVFRCSGDGEWSGWGLVPARVLAGVDPAADWPALERHLLAAGCGETAVSRVLSVRSLDALLRSQGDLLGGEAGVEMLGGREVEPGVWLSRNVVLHPTVRVTPPVYVGEDSRIQAGVKLGPNVLVSRHCIVDEKTRIRESAVFPDSYVGKNLELDGTVVDRNRMVNVRHGAVVDVADDFILGNLGHGYLGSLAGRLWSRGAAVLLLLLLSPLLLVLSAGLALFRRGPLVHRRETVRLPAPPEPGGWRTFVQLGFVPPDAAGGPLRHFLLRFLPGLINVARGEMKFVGLPPRTPDEIEALPGDWRELYLRSSAGLVTEAFIHYGVRADEDERFTAEAMYAARPNLRHDMALIGGYLRRVIFAR